MNSPLLDYKKNNCNKLCGGIAATGTIIKEGKPYRLYSRMYCKKWSCPECGPRRAKQLQRSIAIKAKEHGLSRFLTLTQDPKYLKGVSDPVKHMRNTWRKFRVYLKRKYGKTISFIAVMEYTKSGLPHLHVLIDRYVRQSWISQTWDTLGGGRIVHIEHVTNLDKVGWYLGKYLTKDAILSGPQGVRRFSTSRDIRLREKEPGGDWQVLKGNIEDQYEVHKLSAVNVVAADDGRMRSFAVPKPVDAEVDLWPTEDGTFCPVAAGTKVWFAGFYFDLIGIADPTRGDNETGSNVCQSIEQGATSGGIFDSSPEAIAEQIRRSWPDPNIASIRGSGNSQESGTDIVQSDDPVSQKEQIVPNLAS